MTRHQKPVDRPGAVAQRRVERRQCAERPAVFIELPDGKAKAALGAVDPEYLTALPPGVNRHPRRAEQLGEGFRTQHVLADDNFGDTLAATLARRGKSGLEFGIRLVCVFDTKHVVGSAVLFLHRRDRLRVGCWIDLDPERYAMPELAAACDRFLVPLEQHLLEVCLSR